MEFASCMTVFFCLMVAATVANAPGIAGGMYLTTDQVTIPIDNPSLGQSSEKTDVGQATFADESARIDLLIGLRPDEIGSPHLQDSMGSDVFP